MMARHDGGGERVLSRILGKLRGSAAGRLGLASYDDLASRNRRLFCSTLGHVAECMQLAYIRCDSFSSYINLTSTSYYPTASKSGTIGSNVETAAFRHHSRRPQRRQ